MMDLFKKLVSTLSVAAIVLSSTVTWANGENASLYSTYAPAYQTRTPSKEVKKVLGLEYRMVKTIDSALKKELAAIKDAKLRKHYSAIASARVAGVRGAFAEARSAVKYSYIEPKVENIQNSLRISAKGAYDLINEIRGAAKMATSPLSVSAEEKALVEADIVKFQKELFVTNIQAFLDTYLKDGTKKTGSGKFSVTTPYGTIEYSLERFSNILSMVGFTQEVDFVLKGQMDLAIPSTSYDPKTYQPTKTVIKVKWSTMVDANVKMQGSKMYLTLRDYSLNLTVDGKDNELKEGLAEARVFLDALKGKTVSIDLGSEMDEVSPQLVVSKTRQVLAVLETESIFTPIRRSGTNRYALVLNGKTAADIAKIFWEDVGSLKEVNRELLDSLLSYESNNGKTTIALSDPRGQGAGSVSRNASGYSLHFEGIGRNDSVVFDLTPLGAKLRLYDAGTKVSADWSRNDGAFVLTVTESGTTPIFKTSGTLLLEKMNLVFEFQGTPIGTVSMTKTGNVYAFDLALSFDIPAWMVWNESGKMVIKASENVTVETGAFTIEIPKDAVELEKFLESIQKDPRIYD